MIRREKHAQRARRLEPGEEDRLLAHAGPHLQRLIIAARNRLPEGRAAQPHVAGREPLQRREMVIRVENAKTRTGRVVPLSARLAAVLAMATTDPAGNPFGPEAHVFGDAIGGQGEGHQESLGDMRVEGARARTEVDA
jgi:hypothetical protein